MFDGDINTSSGDKNSNRGDGMIRIKQDEKKERCS